MRPIWRPLQTARFTRAMRRRGGIDVFLSSEHDGYAFPGATTAAVLHDLLPLKRPEWFTAANRRNFLRKLRHVQNDCRIVFTDSECMRHEAITLAGIRPDRLFVAPLAPHPRFQPAAPCDCFADCNAPWGLEGRRVILYVGTIEPRKNLVRLIEAVEHLRRDPRFGDVCLVWCGRIGWKCDDALARARKLEAQGALVRTGYVDEACLPLLYQRCDAFAYVSLDEGFGLPVLEAMASGAPVVCSHAGALPEVAGGAARMVDPEDVASIAEGLRALLEDPSEARRCREAGLRRARDFCWSRTGRHVLQIFREAHRRPHFAMSRKPSYLSR